MKTKRIRIRVTIILGALFGLLWFSSLAKAEEPVYFADANLKAVVEDTLGVIDPTPTDMLSLTILSADAKGIVDLTGIETAVNLTRLELNHNQITDISALSALISLTYLTLSNNNIIDISAVSGLTNLSTLGLGRNQITDISPLSGLMNLWSLGLSDNQISNISVLSEKTNLFFLLLEKNEIVDISVLSGLTFLRYLYLHSNQITDISALSDLTNLTHLTLYRNNIIDVSAISGMTSLVTLALDSNQITDISALSYLTNLKNLSLAHNQISVISALSGLTNLTFLLLNNTQVTDISALSGLTNLTRLDLHTNQISDILVLSGLTSLTYLTLYNNNIVDISAVAGMTNMVTLGLNANQITDISALSGLMSLKNLSLSGNQISDISVLSGQTNLIYLDLRHNTLDIGAYCIYLNLIESNNPGINLLYDENPYSSCNSKPLADAGDNLDIASEDQYTVIIQGIGTDPDDDPLFYRWLEGEIELLSWQGTGENGESYLDLSVVPYLQVGEHVLTLEVSDGQENAIDQMILSIGNSAPILAPAGAGVYEINTPISIGGQVSDFDGDQLNYKWRDGETILFSGVIQSILGGDPVDLPEHVISDLGLGTHMVTLQVDDGVNAPKFSELIIEVNDTTQPTLTLDPDKTILWPPDHQMVDINIEVNASDNSGLPVELITTTISCNEVLDGLGDGETIPDWTEPIFDPVNGLIKFELRAERAGNSNGRIYTITTTATDASGNSSQVPVEIVVPHDKRKK